MPIFSKMYPDNLKRKNSVKRAKLFTGIALVNLYLLWSKWNWNETIEYFEPLDWL